MDVLTLTQASWEEIDKHAKKKLDRAQAAAEKEAEAWRRKQEKRELELAEDESIAKMSAAKNAKKKQGVPKLTQAQIQQNMALMAAVSTQVLTLLMKKMVTIITNMYT